MAIRKYRRDRKTTEPASTGVDDVNVLLNWVFFPSPLRVLLLHNCYAAVCLFALFRVIALLNTFDGLIDCNLYFSVNGPTFHKKTLSKNQPNFAMIDWYSSRSLDDTIVDEIVLASSAAHCEHCDVVMNQL